MIRSVICKSNLRTRENILGRVLIIPCAVFLRDHLRRARSIDMIGSVRVRVDGLGYEL